MIKMNRINILVTIFSFTLAPPLSAQMTPTHGVSILGTLKYPENFTHFEYVNPNAPKGGMVRLGSFGDFDTFNAFSVKGTFAEGADTLLHCTLLAPADDEPASYYGYLAEKVIVASDHKSITFTLNKNAKFSDGTPVTADDVIFSFYTLTKKGLPLFAQKYRDVEKVEKMSQTEVKFIFSTDENRQLPAILGQFPILSKAYYQKHDFEKTDLTPPVCCGPYQIKEFEAGKRVVYTRIPNWWGENLPSQKGLNNFDMSYDYYRDENILLQAFESGKYDFHFERSAKDWATGYNIPAVKEGKVILQKIPNKIPIGTQAFIFNTRRPIFADRKVREALADAFDFEWMNKHLCYNAYTRSLSYFNNSPMSSSGLPEGEELKILELYKDKLPPEVFTQAFTLPIAKETGYDRKPIEKANAVLQSAGWIVKNEERVNAKTGEPLTFEFLLTDPLFERAALALQRNFKDLGIRMTIRTVTLSEYTEAVENYDYDMIAVFMPQAEIPGNEQRDFWGSKSALTGGGENYSGINDPVVDALIELVVSASDRQTLIDRVHALDRVLLWGYYAIPTWYMPFLRIAYWNKFGMPKKKPKDGIGFNTWWLLGVNRK